MHVDKSLITVSMALGLLVLIVFASGSRMPAAEPPQEGGGPKRIGGYEVVEDWPKPLPDNDLSHDGWTWGSGAGVWPERPDKVWIQQRGEIELPPGAEPWTFAGLLSPPRTNTGRWPYSGSDPGYRLRRHHIVFAVDRQGNTVEEWLHLDDFLAPPRPTTSRGPHKLLMNPYDPEKHIWIVDDDLHQIYKLTNDGKLVMTLGERGVPGRGPNNFNRPTDIAWLPDGTFFVADGYAGVRVAKFDPNGKFLFDWGEVPADPENPGPNEFFSVHSIGISRDRRVFVADREHMRMQVFDENGRFLEMWPTGHNSRVYAHIVTEDDYVWVADEYTQRLVKYDLNGRYVLDFGEPGWLPGQFDGVHQISVDQEGNLYVTEVHGDRSQKFRPLPDADPALLVAPMVGVRSQWGASTQGSSRSEAPPSEAESPSQASPSQVSPTQVSPTQALQQYVRVPERQAHANVHMGPSTGRPVLLLVPKGTVLPVVGREGEWVAVRLSPELRKVGMVMRWYENEDRGYVHETAVESVAEKPDQ